MTDNVFSSVLENFQPFLAPVVKANQLALADLEKLIAFQTNALLSYTDLCLGQLQRSATPISDPQSLQTFYANQAETASALCRKMVDDGKALFELGASFRAEFNHLLKDSLAGLMPKAG